MAATKPKITTETRIVTPELALEWYALSGGNRPIRKTHVEYLIDQMRNHWTLNGEAIIFDWNNKLIEGHHRLIASAEGEVTFETLVVRGVNPDAKATINTGRGRSQADALSFEHKGLGSVNTVATTLMRLLEWERGRLSSPTAQKISNAEVVEAYAKFPNVEQSVREVHGCRQLVAVSRLAWLHYLTNRKHPNKCEEFFSRLATGLELTREDPIWLLRQRLINAKSAGRGSLSMPLNEGLALLVKSWNAFYKNKPLKQLRWVAKTEDFPKVEGV